MDFIANKMTQDTALHIVNDWKYEGQYSFYDMGADIEDHEEFVDEASRNRIVYY